ncbi:MAG: hypothetical protein ACYDD1_18945 [Caulobacteraceae bacterium]
MTPALYQIIFTGEFDENTGAFYLGHGLVCGMDSSNCRYDGRYEIDGPTIRLELEMQARAGRLPASGLDFAAPTTLPITAALPLASLIGGDVQTVEVGGGSILIRLLKLRDLP